MKYMLLIYLAEDAMDEAAREHCYHESAQLCQNLAASGHFLAAAPLHPVSTATSVRVRHGKPIVTDGPFAETREQLGGYYSTRWAPSPTPCSPAGRPSTARMPRM
jgi:hypothetical protein